MPLSKNQIKLVTSLTMKKFRDETGLFIAEGTKIVRDLLHNFKCSDLFATTNWINENQIPAGIMVHQVNDYELKKISQQKNPQGVLAVFQKPEYHININNLKNKLSIALDDVQDPGNLGTIIRLADWFGIEDIFCSSNSADAYGPKTVQATMGALAHVKVHYVQLPEFFQQIPPELIVYGTFMEGNNIYAEKLSEPGIIVLGNEGNGISSETEKFVNRKIKIPDFSNGEKSAESLNVAVAGAIVCSEFRRRTN